MDDAVVAFTKPASTIAQQIAKLKSRGLSVADEAAAELRLIQISYYRFSGYVLHFRSSYLGLGLHDVKHGSSFEDVCGRYDFDRKLRAIILEATEDIEIWFKSQTFNTMSLGYGPHWYLNQGLFVPNFDHAALIADINRQLSLDPRYSVRRSIPVKHYMKKYTSPAMPASWIVFDEISFGTMSYVFKNIRQNLTTPICKKTNFHHDVISSWLHSFSYVRNICAHHARLWNRSCTLTPMIPRRLNIQIRDKTSVYTQVLFMRILQSNIGLNSSWHLKLKALAIINKEAMLEAGFPADWDKFSEWQ